MRRLPYYLPWLALVGVVLPAGGTVVYDDHMIGYLILAAFAVLVIGLFVSYVRRASRGEKW